MDINREGGEWYSRRLRRKGIGPRIKDKRRQYLYDDIEIGLSIIQLLLYTTLMTIKHVMEDHCLIIG